MRRSFAPFVVLILVVAATAAIPAHECEPAARPSGLLSIPSARIPMDGVLSGGQPTREQIEAAAASGFGTVINLRLGLETGFEWEAETVEGLGMRYVSIPVAGSRGLTLENVRRIDAALSEAAAAGPVLLHCASGNRIGAILALRAAWLHGVEPASAIAHGLANGMTRLEPAVRGLLDLQPAGSVR
jgi:uncharacterized protein (TIGR01244 family)